MYGNYEPVHDLFIQQVKNIQYKYHPPKLLLTRHDLFDIYNTNVSKYVT